MFVVNCSNRIQCLCLCLCNLSPFLNAIFKCQSYLQVGNLQAVIG